MAFAVPDAPLPDVTKRNVLLRDGTYASLGVADEVSARLKEAAHRLGGMPRSGVNLHAQVALRYLHELAHSEKTENGVKAAKDTLPVLRETGLLDENNLPYEAHLPVLRAAIEKQGLKYVIRSPMRSLQHWTDKESHDILRARASYAGLANPSDWSRYIQSAAQRGGHNEEWDKTRKQKGRG